MVAIVLGSNRQKHEVQREEEQEKEEKKSLRQRAQQIYPTTFSTPDDHYVIEHPAVRMYIPVTP